MPARPRKSVTLTLTAHQAKVLYDHICAQRIIDIPLSHVRHLKDVRDILKEKRDANK